MLHLHSDGWHGTARCFLELDWVCGISHGHGLTPKALALPPRNESKGVEERARLIEKGKGLTPLVDTLTTGFETPAW